MPFKDHPYFRQPDDGEVPVWRYIDTSKFVSLLMHRALWFTRAGLLVDSDPYEGVFTHANASILNVEWNSLDEAVRKIPEFSTAKQFELQKTIMRSLLGTGPAIARASTFLNCWHSNKTESAAMWRLYCGDKDGLCIRSTYSKLLSSFSSLPVEVSIGLVNYINYENDSIDTSNTMALITHKRDSFSHEQEIRAVIMWNAHLQDYLLSKGVITNRKEPNFYNLINNDLAGFNADVSLEILIDEVCLSPYSTPWYAEVIAKIMEMFDLRKPLKLSKMAIAPLKVDSGHPLLDKIR